MNINETKLNEFMGKAVGDLGAALHAGLALLGDRLGLYKAMADGKPITPAELAKRTETDERYVTEWLNAQAAGGYIEYQPQTKTYSLPPEQAMALTMEDSPVYIPGAYQVILALLHDVPKIEEAFRSKQGVGWHEHHPGLFEGTERFFRPNYNAHLVTEWIPSLTGVEEKLKKGAKVADIGCGHGASTILMAKTYPNSKFYGFDYHKPSIEWAKKAAARAGVSANTQFEVASSTEFPGKDYDLVAFFDCLHDMGNPAAAATHVKQSLKSDGTWMLVEPFAGDKVEENLNPVGRVFYSASTLVCTPASRAQEGAACLGAQAGEGRLKDVATRGGFTRFRRSASTPFNLVLEIKP